MEFSSSILDSLTTIDPPNEWPNNKKVEFYKISETFINTSNDSFTNESIVKFILSSFELL